MTAPADRLVCNEHLEHLVCNLDTQNVRRETLEGRPHLVVPGAVIVEGVLTANMGAGFYPADENARAVLGWNHRPIMLDHPKDKAGKFCSAASPEAINLQKLGITLAANQDALKTRVEYWFDEERTKTLDPELYADIEAKRSREVSPGVFILNKDDRPGEYLGRTYDWVARGQVPDHVAILRTGTKGASSLSDGNGLYANQAAVPVANEMSMGDTEQALRKALREKYQKPGYEWGGCVVDVFPDFLVYEVYEDGNFQLYKIAYKVTDGGVSLTGEPEKVNRVVQYQVAANGALAGNSLDWRFVTNSEGNKMATKFDPKAHVDALIANGQYKEDQRAKLMATDPDLLESIPVKEKPAASVAANQAATVPAVQPAPVVTKPVPLALNEYVAQAPPELQEPLQELLAEHEATKTTLIEEITANKACPFSKEYLSTQKLPFLKGLAQMAKASAPVAANQNPNPPMFRNGYQGQAAGVPPVAANQDGNPLGLEPITVNEEFDYGFELATAK